MACALVALTGTGCGDPTCPAGYRLDRTVDRCVILGVDAATDAGLDASSDGDAGSGRDACAAAEACDYVDEDCNGIVDDGAPHRWHAVVPPDFISPIGLLGVEVPDGWVVASDDSHVLALA